MLKLLITTVLFVGLTNSEIIKDHVYKIQNEGDGTFLTLSTEVVELCNPLGNVTTEKKGNEENQIWTLTWWGDTPEQFGVHLLVRNTLNEITYDTRWPPFCYPVYFSWELIETSGGGYLIQNREDGNCLDSTGNGELIQRNMCRPESQQQLWNIVPV